MGQVHCRAHDNQSLVDILKDSGADFTDDTERAFRLLDRGTYCDPEDNFDIYCDVAFRRRYLHLSAPSIYASAIYHLDLRPGQSFLNIGSGTGYLSTIAGLLLGPNGINHGIEHIVSNVSFARNQLNNFLTNSDAPYEREFCVPYFITGNIFNLVPPAGNISVKENDPGDTENDNDDETDLDNILITFHHHFDSIVPALVNGVPQIRMNEATTGSEDETEINTLEPKEDEQIENELTKDTPKRDNSLCDSFNRIADNQRNSLDERFAPNSSDNSENQTTDEEHYEIVNLPGSSILPRIMEVEPPPLLRPRPHQTENSLLNCDSDAEAVEFWLTYDRIYVGAGLTTNAQLLALLRLLRVGGRMVAPFEDCFMAISRVSNNEFTSQYLLPTSFMPIVMPHPNSLPTYITPPPRVDPVPRLEELCSRCIRDHLRRAIKWRHNGLPQLARLERIKKRSRRKPAATTTSPNEIKHELKQEPFPTLAGEKATTEFNSDESAIAKKKFLKTRCNGITNPPKADDSTSHLDNTIVLFESISEMSTASSLESTLTDEDQTASSSDGVFGTKRLLQPKRFRLRQNHQPELIDKIRIATNAGKSPKCDIAPSFDDPSICQQMADGATQEEISGQNGKHFEDHSETEAGDDDADDSGQNDEKRSNFRILPASYSYREEMRRILTEELHVRDFFVRTILRIASG